MFFFAVLLMLAIVLFACIMNASKSYNVSVIMHGLKNASRFWSVFMTCNILFIVRRVVLDRLALPLRKYCFDSYIRQGYIMSKPILGLEVVRTGNPRFGHLQFAEHVL